MLVVNCPQCRVELDLDDSDLGHAVECPACAHRFEAERPAVPESELPPPVPSDATVQAEAIAIDVAPVAAQPISPPPPQVLSAAPPSNEVIVECQHCLGKVSVLRLDLGHRVECPICKAVFRAQLPRTSKRDEDDDDDRPRRRRRRDLDRDSDRMQRDLDEYSPRQILRNATEDLNAPGGASMVLGWIEVVFGVLNLGIGGLFLSAATGGPAATGALGWGIWHMAGGLGGMLIGIVRVIGGKAMREVKHRPMALWASILGLVPLSTATCLFFLTGPSYVVSLVFCIIALGRLNQTHVKKAFELNRPDGDVDAA